MTPDQAKKRVADYLTGARVPLPELEEACRAAGSDREYVERLGRTVGLRGVRPSPCAAFRSSLAEFCELTKDEARDEMPELYAHVQACPACRTAYWGLLDDWWAEDPAEPRARVLSRAIDVALTGGGICEQGLGPPAVRRARVALAAGAGAEAEPPPDAEPERQWRLADAEADVEVVVTLRAETPERADLRVELIGEGSARFDRRSLWLEVEDVERRAQVLAAPLQDRESESIPLTPGRWRVRLAARVHRGTHRVWVVPLTIARRVAMAVADRLLAEYRRVPAIQLGTNPSDPWPGVSSVENQLAEIVERAHELEPVGDQDYQRVFWLYILPNVLHWAIHMHETNLARPYQGTCPMSQRPETPGRGEEGSGDFDSWQTCPESDRLDVCRSRFEKHPWALQVTLLWNAAARGEAPVPCAWNVYDRIPHQWPDPKDGGPTSPRPQHIRDLWDKWEEELQRANDAARNARPRYPGDESYFADALAHSVAPTALYQLVDEARKAWNRRVEEMLGDAAKFEYEFLSRLSSTSDAQARRRQEAAVASTPARRDKMFLAALARAADVKRDLDSALVMDEAGDSPPWEFDPEQNRLLVDTFLEVFKALFEYEPPPGAPDPEAQGRRDEHRSRFEACEQMLMQGPLAAAQQRTLRGFASDAYKRFRALALRRICPKGDAMYVEDLFWDWVYRAPRPDDRPPFELPNWVAKRWGRPSSLPPQARDYERILPNWRRK